jgi:hypothetical protein
MTDNNNELLTLLDEQLDNLAALRLLTASLGSEPVSNHRLTRVEFACPKCGAKKLEFTEPIKLSEMLLSINKPCGSCDGGKGGQNGG